MKKILFPFFFRIFASVLVSERLGKEKCAATPRDSYLMYLRATMRLSSLEPVSVPYVRIKRKPQLRSIESASDDKRGHNLDHAYKSYSLMTIQGID